MISTTKRLLINELIATSEDKLKELSLDDPIIETLFEFLENPDTDIELLKSITKKLYELYQTQDHQLQLITLSFVPTLIAIYFRVAHNYYNLPKCEFHSLAILLLCVYNFEIINCKSGELKTIDIRLISLSKPSIYHEPNSNTNQSIQASIPTEQMLARINNPNESRISIFGPFTEVEQLNIGNYQSVCTILLKVYNQYIAQMGHFSLHSLCRLFLQLLKQGTDVDIREKINLYLHSATIDKLDCHSELLPSLPMNCIQIQFSSEVLTEITRIVYYCLYNDLEDIALELVDEIAKRSAYKLYGDVLLMVNAIKNTQAIKNQDQEEKCQLVKNTNQSQVSLNGHSHFVNMGSTTSIQRKTAITNASFKTRKLPDDIPIVTSATTPSSNSMTNSQANRSNARSVSKGASVSQNNTNASLVKSLDSINEEHQPQIANYGQPTKVINSNGTRNRKGVMHLLKELKEKPKKSSLVKTSENGKSTCEYNNGHNIVTYNGSEKSNSEECIALSTFKTTDQKSKKKKFPGEDDEQNDGDDQRDDRERFGMSLLERDAIYIDQDEAVGSDVNEDMALVVTGDKSKNGDSSDESDRSGSSSKALLSSNKNNLPATVVTTASISDSNSSKLLTVQNSI